MHSDPPPSLARRLHGDHVIGPKIAARATPLLSNAVVRFVGDEHVAVVFIPRDPAANSQRLGLLGSDSTALAAALNVIARRTDPDGGA